MEPAPFLEEVSERKICVVGSELVENYTVYVIDVTDGVHKWTVKHRYSDFHDLHEKLTTERKVDRRLLPPKKMLGKNSKSLVEKRQKELELYLQTLLQQFPEATPTPLACFLHFHLYEMNGITAALAEELFHKGEELLQAGEVFSLRPLQLHSVSQQLRLAKPTCFNGNAKSDLGHILDFTCRLRYLRISGTVGPVGSSNIQESSLPFDLSVFKSLLQIEICDCSSQQIKGLSCLRSSLATMSVHRSTESMMSILVPEASEFSQWEPEGAESGSPVTAVVPAWRNLTTLDMSHNCISGIDGSVKLIPKVEFLDLSYNQLSSVENLQHLYNLVHVDLSYNNLKALEAAHTRLGNIKTLNLCGNHLERLSGLTKLYSLVNLDLSHNHLAQLDEVRNIGALPCLEKLNLSSNPMCIVPDYRTKVLAQFGDRAAEVCLDCKATTEKELDMVEVLKAIQKAKEVKDRKSESDKKVGEETRRPSATAPLPPQPASQELTSRAEEEAAAPPGVPTNAPALSANPPRAKTPESALCIKTSTSTRCACSSSRLDVFSAGRRLFLPAPLFSLASDKDFLAQLSQRLGSALRDQETEKKAGEEKAEKEEEWSSESRDASTDVSGVSPTSRDGYFEMGLDDSVEETTSLPVPGDPNGRSEDDVEICRILWCCCVRVDGDVKQSAACLVLTYQLLALLCLSLDPPWTNQEADQQAVLSNLHVDLLLPFSEFLPLFHNELPDSCFSFSRRAASARWFVFSEAEELRRARADLMQVFRSRNDPEFLDDPQLLPASLINSWEQEESQGAKGGYTAFLVSSSDPALSEIPSEELGLPSLIFLTHKNLWVLRMDHRELPPIEASSNSPWCKLERVPLGSSVLHPNDRDVWVGNASCTHPLHHHRFHHCVEMLLNGQKLLLLFPLAQNRLSFLAELSQRRASLEGLQTVALPRPRSPPPDDHRCRDRKSHNSVLSDYTSSSDSSSWGSSTLHMDEPSPHLLPALSPGLKLLAGLRGPQLTAYFHAYIAQSETEELRQVLWLSAVLYKSPETELSCCLMLSTGSIYFLLEDPAPAFSGDSDSCLSSCLTIGLSELLAVNVGLFDQYFRVVGHSAEQIICCLSRDSYATGIFLQELMSVLSLQQQLPAPEPSDQDFYSQFTDTGSGKMKNYELIHSSKVKFVYPSEEEMGDLTFIVAERKTSAGSVPSSCFNILLYLLVFQVEIPNTGTVPASAVLQPRTLILTGTDVFLLDEDYVSHPLPDFAKEPPSREHYQLREARRIRDLDRVLMGYQTYPQALTLVFDDLPGPDLLCHLTMDHFTISSGGEEAPPRGGAEGEVQWCIFVPGADSRERLISLLARQWEALCSRELPVELTG